MNIVYIFFIDFMDINGDEMDMKKIICFIIDNW